MTQQNDESMVDNTVKCTGQIKCTVKWSWKNR